MVFCSPKCGHRCTKARHDLAWQRARALAKRLGDGWEPRVWENMGWHYDVKKADCISVKEYWPRVYDDSSAIEKLAALVPESYTVFLHEVGGHGGGRWTGRGSTPEEAIADALGKLNAERAELEEIAETLADEMHRGS